MIMSCLRVWIYGSFCMVSGGYRCGLSWCRALGVDLWPTLTWQHLQGMSLCLSALPTTYLSRSSRAAWRWWLEDLWWTAIDPTSEKLGGSSKKNRCEVGSWAAQWLDIWGMPAGIVKWCGMATVSRRRVCCQIYWNGMGHFSIEKLALRCYSIGSLW